jgi:DNA-binding beta-propeller fold protein YncE
MSIYFILFTELSEIPIDVSNGHQAKVNCLSKLGIFTFQPWESDKMIDSKFFPALCTFLTCMLLSTVAVAQTNPYQQVDAPSPPPHLNDGRWGEMIQVRVGPDGNVYVYHRCFKVVLGDPNVAPGHSDGLSANCLGRWSGYPPILKFNSFGEFLDGFGTGLVGRPHGFSVDHEGNMWLTDVALIENKMGAVVLKLSPEGELLLTLGIPGVVGEGRDRFNRPASVAVAQNGNIFVADGEGPNNRIVKFAPDGSYISEWGTTGSGPGQFNTPHDLAIDSRGRLFVGDRGNNRVQIFESDGTYVEQWHQFGRPSGIYINRVTDTLYVTDSTSNSRTNPGVQRGIYVGSASTGVVHYFIPDPDLELTEQTRISGASGITSSPDDSVIYAADVAPWQLRKYVKQ